MTKDNSDTGKPAESAAAVAPSPSSTKFNAFKKVLISATAGIILAACLLVGASFYAGVQYQKRQQDNPRAFFRDGRFESDDSYRGDRMGDRGFRGMRGMQNTTTGEVTSVNDSSITVKTAGTGSKTFTVDGTTSVSQDGKLVTMRDIQKGDTVLIVAADNADIAKRIIIDPPTRGGGVMMYPESGNSSTL